MYTTTVHVVLTRTSIKAIIHMPNRKEKLNTLSITRTLLRQYNNEGFHMCVFVVQLPPVYTHS